MPADYGSVLEQFMALSPTDRDRFVREVSGKDHWLESPSSPSLDTPPPLSYNELVDTISQIPSDTSEQDFITLLMKPNIFLSLSAHCAESVILARSVVDSPIVEEVTAFQNLQWQAEIKVTLLSLFVEVRLSIVALFAEQEEAAVFAEKFGLAYAPADNGGWQAWISFEAFKVSTDGNIQRRSLEQTFGRKIFHSEAYFSRLREELFHSIKKMKKIDADTIESIAAGMINPPLSREFAFLYSSLTTAVMKQNLLSLLAE